MPDGLAFEAPEVLRLLWGLPVVVLLYLFRRRARRLLVPFLPFWQRVFNERRRRPTFVRTIVSILLQLVAATSIVVALAKPYREESRSAPARSVVVLDWTLGTRMKSGEGTLAGAVLARGREVLAHATTEGPVSVALLRGGLEPRPANEPAGELRAADLPSPSGTRSLDALVALRRATDPGTRIFFVTPFEVPAGALTGATVLAAGPGAGPNGGIRRVDHPAGEAALHVLAAGSGEARTLRLVGPDSAELASAPVPPEGGEVRIALPPDGPADATLRLDPPDAFPEDDSCPLDLPERGKLRIIVASDVATPTLDSALLASSIMDGAASGRVPLAQLGAVFEGFDVAVVVGAGAPADLPPGRYLLLDTFPSTLPMKAVAGTGEARATKMAAAAPGWLKTLDVDEWRIHKMSAVEAGPGLDVLVESTRGPLVARAEHAGVRAVIVSVRPDVTASTLPLLPAFPLMLRGALLELAPRAAAAGPAVHRAGGRIVLVSAEAAAFTAEDGTARPLRLAPDGGGFELPEAVGRWRAGTRRVATAWLDHPALPGEPRTADDPWPATPRRTERRSFQREVLLVLLAVLLVEWCSYHFGGTD